MPTETVYGLAVRGDDAAALERLRALKNRDGEAPFTPWDLIEVPVDYSENETVFLEELKQRTCIL